MLGEDLAIRKPRSVNCARIPVANGDEYNEDLTWWKSSHKVRLWGGKWAICVIIPLGLH